MDRSLKFFIAGVAAGVLGMLVIYADNSPLSSSRGKKSLVSSTLGESGSFPAASIEARTNEAREKKADRKLELAEIQKTTNEVSQNAPMTIPQSLLYKITPLVTSYNDLELLPVSLLGYGLNPEQSQKLITFINGMAGQVSDLEAANSRLVKDSNGDEFYEIKSFQKQGEAIKASINEFIESTFAGFDDDRALVFRRQLEASPIFDDYGKTTRQISIEERKNGSGDVDLLFSLIRIEDGVEVANSTNGLKPRMLQNRYFKVVDKNKK